MLSNIAGKYANAQPEQRAMIDMILAVNSEDMTDFQKT